MKNILLFALVLLLTGCCDTIYHDSLAVSIYKDDKPLREASVKPEFFYKDKEGKEIVLDFITASPSRYLMNSSIQLEKLFYNPKQIFIRYNNLPEIDTLEVLLDCVSTKGSSCKCPEIELKYMKYNSVLIPDHTIRK